MFGYVQINQPELKMKDLELYRSYYCGLCHVLKERYGRRAQMLLNYDMTFLTVLLSGLYELEEEKAKRRCIPHAIRPHEETIGDMTEYAADMTVLLYYQKALDDWRDDHSHPKRALAMLLYKDYKRLRSRYPRQARTLEHCLRRLSEAEKAGSTDIDLVCGLTGSFLAEMFVWKDDFWQEDLRIMGFYLGKFIYLMDAYDDLEKDLRRDKYNPLRQLAAKSPDQVDMLVQEMLEDMMSGCARAFERLPVLRNADILRNILYSGVWVRCAAVRKERDARKDRQSNARQKD